MNSKKYVIRLENGKYLQGYNVLGSKVDAKRYKLKDLPPSIGNKNLFRIGRNTPLCWKYVSTCGQVAVIEEA